MRNLLPKSFSVLSINTKPPSFFLTADRPRRWIYFETRWPCLVMTKEGSATPEDCIPWFSWHTTFNEHLYLKTRSAPPPAVDSMWTLSKGRVDTVICSLQYIGNCYSNQYSPSVMTKIVMLSKIYLKRISIVRHFLLIAIYKRSIIDHMENRSF